MKLRNIHIYLGLLVLGLSNAHAQTPQKMNYQAVIRDVSNTVVANTAIGIKISILNAASTEVYSETQTPTTNANGLISIEIGSGSSFSSIDWSAGTYYIKLQVDPAGGTNYTVTTTSQLVSVPYALNAAKVDSIFFTKVTDSTTKSKTIKINLTQSDTVSLNADTTWGYLMQTQGRTLTKTWSTGNTVAVDSVVGPVNTTTPSLSYPLLEAPLTRTYGTDLWRIQGEYVVNAKGAALTKPAVIVFQVRSIGSGVLVYVQTIMVPTGLTAGTVVPFSLYFPTIADATSEGLGYKITLVSSLGNSLATNGIGYRFTSITRTNF
ncbi:MAG: hypothetical protein QM610_12210 [Chitinophagaceae bacterium]